MKLVNIYNNRRQLYLFLRDESGKQVVNTINNFFPYFYTPDPNGNYKSYKGETLRKIIMSAPKEVAKNRGANSYEADIFFTRRFLIDRVDKLEKCPIKYAFIDIEVQSDELPDVTKAKQPISCISVYSSFNKSIQTFYLGDYKTEYELIEDFIKYMKKEKFDLWLSWNVKFDYNYLYNRVPDFGEKISPIGRTRYGDGDVFYPAGISIVDYLTWFKKVTFNREKAYALDYIAQRHLGEKPNKKVDFSQITPELKEKNRHDIERMIKLEEKFQLISYYDEIRRLSKVEWEDLIWNSRILDMLLLAEAKRQNVVLPMRPHDIEKEDFEGAFREAFETGMFNAVGKYDLTSAYPFAIIDYCLDPANIVESGKGEERGGNEERRRTVTIEGTKFEQNEEALLPTVVKQLMILKNNIKKELNQHKVDTPEYKIVKRRYEAIKSVVNSAYGVMGNRFFRLYDKRVASATTFIVRDVLHYVKSALDLQNYKVIYVDTDSIFIQSQENLTNKLNDLINRWAKEKYGKDNIDIEFEYEGNFKDLLILTKCRYVGHLQKKQGLELEMKGVEAKRKDSTTFMKKFQTELINKILKREAKEDIITWIKEQIEKVKDTPLAEISFPCKLARPPENYKNVPIFLRALRNTPNYEKKVGDPYYYIFMEGKDNTKKQMVMAFDENNYQHINKTIIDWKQMINRNIVMKLDTIFTALGWNISEVIHIEEKKKRKKNKNTKKVA